MKYILNEELFDDVPNVNIEPLTQDEIELEAPSSNEEFGATAILVDSIKNTWDMVDRYNTALASIPDENISKVIKDILDSELINIGRLEDILKIVSPNAENIDVVDSVEGN